MLRKAGNNIGAAAEELTLLEAEHAGQQKVLTATRKAAATKQPTVRRASFNGSWVTAQCLGWSAQELIYVGLLGTQPRHFKPSCTSDPEECG